MAIGVSSSQRRVILLALGCLAFARVYSNVVMFPLITSISAEFDVSVGTAGLAAAAFGVAAIPLGLLIGPYGDRVGRKPLLIVGALMLAIFNLLSTVAPSFPVLVATRVLVGAGAPLIFAMTQASLADLFDYRERTRALSLLIIADQIGPLFGVPLAGVLAEAFSWRVAVALVGVLALAGTVAFVRYFPAGAAAPAAAAPAGHRALFGLILRNRSASLPLLGFAVAQIGWFAWVVFLIVFFERTYGLSPAVAASLALVNALGLMAGGLAVGRLSDRVSNRSMAIAVGVAAAVVFPVLTLFTLPLPLAVVLVFAISALTSGRFAATTVLLVGQVPAARGTMGSLLAANQGLGQAVGPMIGGMLFDRFVFPGIGIFAGAMAAFGAALIAQGRERARAEPPGPGQAPGAG